MSRPKMYLPSLSAEELVRYATQYEFETELEAELTEYLMDLLEDSARLEKEETLSCELGTAGEELVQVLKSIVAEEDDEILDEVEEYTKRTKAAYKSYYEKG